MHWIGLYCIFWYGTVLYCFVLYFILLYLLHSSSNASDGTILAVLDVSKRELSVPAYCKDALHHLFMPDSDALCAQLRDCLLDRSGSESHLSNPSLLGMALTRSGPLYSFSSNQKQEIAVTQEIISSHISSVLSRAEDYRTNCSTTDGSTSELRLSNKSAGRVLSLSNNSLLFSGFDIDSERETDDELSPNNSRRIDSSESGLDKLLQYYSSIVEDTPESESKSEGVLTNLLESNDNSNNEKYPVESIESDMTDGIAEISTIPNPPKKPPKPPKLNKVVSGVIPDQIQITRSNSGLIDSNRSDRGSILLNNIPFQDSDENTSLFFKRFITTQVLSPNILYIIQSIGLFRVPR